MRRFARLVLLATPETGRQLEATFCALEGKARELYQRPYLARGSAERLLLMLKALLEVSASRRTQQSPVLTSWLSRRGCGAGGGRQVCRGCRRDACVLAAREAG